jgi:hypothetical protein
MTKAEARGKIGWHQSSLGICPTNAIACRMALSKSPSDMYCFTRNPCAPHGNLMHSPKCVAGKYDHRDLRSTGDRH